MIPFDFAERIVSRIVSSIDAPVSVDFEGGYSEDDDELAANVSRLIEIGAVGINFEDRLVHGTGLYDIDRQAQRIAAIRTAADRQGVAFFINARTDLFLGQGSNSEQAVDAALTRAKAYANAGASGFFIPGLQDERLIGRICEGADLPVNVMMMEDGTAPVERLRALGVARISYGAAPYIACMDALKEHAKKVLS